MSWYKMHRGWQNHEVFSDEKYTEREAWEWLISHAAYRPFTKNIAGNPVKLETGQVSHSIRYLAEAWQWNKGKTERFLKKLKKWDMIQIKSGTGQNIISICEYTKYQSDEIENGTEVGHQTGQERDRSGTNKKKYKEIKRNKEDISREFDEEFWPLTVKKKSVGAARKAYISARTKASKEEILVSWKAHNAIWLPKKGTEDWGFVPHPSTWLNQQRWKDEIDEDSRSNNSGHGGKSKRERAREALARSHAEVAATR